jgi:hypothetical protein
MTRGSPPRPFARLEWDRAGASSPETITLRPLSETYPAQAEGQTPRDRLILGDNLAVMAALMPELKGGST